MRVSYLGTSESAAFIAANSVRIPLYSESMAISDLNGQSEEKPVDLNTLCIPNPGATFFVRAQGESMVKEGIHAGDVLVVNRSLAARHGDIVIAFERGKMAVMTLQLKPDVLLRPKNKAYAATVTPVVESEAPSLEVFGVVTSVVRQLERG
ncbi:UV protection and mutation protein [Marinomonas rhizomae]|uniref:S24 family peptidase n=1 Tax=Marinomonas rhizomae TaxID=491948 RepID=UPI0021036AFC|nr:S24 family peptidase [Marinomonas rhizomae]UTW01144.1 UV protection and mutation protein [Marinomonas rhizomae]